MTVPKQTKLEKVLFKFDFTKKTAEMNESRLDNGHFVFHRIKVTTFKIRKFREQKSQKFPAGIIYIYNTRLISI